jgi:ferritin-like metal-binding protein YciE
MIEVLQKYQAQVSHHIENFNTFFEKEEISSLSISNTIMHALIGEINEKITFCTDHEVKDACLLAGIQEINHYKISMYGTAAAFARMLENEEAARIFHDAEINEKQIDDRLTQLAEFEVNKKARSPLALHE